HAGAYVNGATRNQSGTNGVTVLQPGVVSYISPEGEPVYLCDEFNDGTNTWVLDARTDTWVAAGTAGAECYLAISASTGDPIFDPIWDTYDTVIEAIIALLTELDEIILGVEREVDKVICPALALLTGTYGPVFINAQGDIYIDGAPFWDCPPYDVIWP
ncbi:MAG TPA: hypothetical protein VNQ77_19475, partial [Frankiaceae bacterium]|nr:hypothetical protein [Frankiaceae bacterium]